MRLLERGRTVAVILGAQAWPYFSDLNGGRAFSNSAAEIKSYLIDPDGIGLNEEEDILDLFDSPESADEQLNAIAEFIRGWDAQGRIDDNSISDLFLYYVGHGDFIGNSTDFVMLVQASRPRRETSAIPARALATVLRDEAPFVRQVVVLDCCWSGAAHRTWQSSTAPDVAARVAAELMPNNGTVLLCSSSESMPSMAPEGAELTMFTAGLIEALHAGSIKIRGDLSPRQVRDLAYAAMRWRWGADAVRPVVYAIERGSGDLSDTPIFPNRAWPNETRDNDASSPAANNSIGHRSPINEEEPSATADSSPVISSLGSESLGSSDQQTPQGLDLAAEPPTENTSPSPEASTGRQSLIRKLLGPAAVAAAAAMLIIFGVSQYKSSPTTDTNPKEKYESLVAAGNKAYDDGDFNKAIDQFSEAIRIDPSSSDAFFYRARAYGPTGKRDFNRAVADYSEVIRISPNSVGAIVNRANAYLNLNQWDRAIADANTVIQLEPTKADPGARRLAFFYRASAYRYKSQFAAAIADFGEAIKLDAKYAAAYCGRAKSLFASGDAVGGDSDYDKAKQFGSKDCT